jgi:beta-glucosidase
MTGATKTRTGSTDIYLGVGIENCWMAQHDPRIRPGKRLLDVHLQMQHYERWKEDLQLAADLGINAIRYSVPWYRANPAPGRYDWSWIENPIGWLRERGITPIIDLIHYGAPLWMEQECLDPSFPERLAEYASAFAARFAGAVDHYTPFNEPQTLAKKAGYLGLWPPYASGLDGWLKATLAIARAMVLASEALRRTLPAVTLVSADNPWAPPPDELRRACGDPRAACDGSVDLLWACLASSLAYGLVDPDGPAAGCLVALGCRREDLAWFRARARKPDLLGYNYYCYGVPEEESALAREVDKMVAECSAAQAHFGLPLYISETSGGRTEAQKLQWVRALEKVIGAMRRKGVPVMGLNWWPLYETIQWDYRDNDKTAFECIRPGGWNNGLYVIQLQPDGKLRRVRTAAAAAYAGLLERAARASAP